jgi:hypothetical protein
VGRLLRVATVQEILIHEYWMVTAPVMPPKMLCANSTSRPVGTTPSMMVCLRAVERITCRPIELAGPSACAYTLIKALVVLGNSEKQR